MILSDGYVISRADVSPYKYGGDPMAEFLSYLSGSSGFDRCTGDAIDWHYWVAQYGKRLEFCDTQGFVWVDKYDTEAEATAAFDEIEAEYCEYEGDE